jgi:hypothetical protein
VEFGLGSANGGIEVVIGQGWVQDFVAVVLQVGRLQAALGRLPAVEEEDGHCFVSLRLRKMLIKPICR